MKKLIVSALLMMVLVGCSQKKENQLVCEGVSYVGGFTSEIKTVYQLDDEGNVQSMKQDAVISDFDNENAEITFEEFVEILEMSKNSYDQIDGMFEYEVSEDKIITSTEIDYEKFEDDSLDFSKESIQEELELAGFECK